MINIYNYIQKEDLFNIIKSALKEDVPANDVTSELIFRNNEDGEFELISKEKGILCGKEVFSSVFWIIDEEVVIDWFKEEGEKLYEEEVIASLKGSIISILKGERVALNFLSHLSGIATETKKLVEKGKGIKVKDTRKTTPLLRKLEKYAVKVGGGENHRFSLSDGIMFKDNHKKLAGGIENILEVIKKKGLEKEVILEVETVSELELAISYGIKYILLDNMSIENIKRCVEITGGRAFLEVSGGVNIENIEDISKTGVDAVSTGYITHSFRAFNFSLEAKRRL
jgi:nicotinate-nucleotide pyrophosphorylase